MTNLRKRTNDKSQNYTSGLIGLQKTTAKLEKQLYEAQDEEQNALDLRDNAMRKDKLACETYLLACQQFENKLKIYKKKKDSAKSSLKILSDQVEMLNLRNTEETLSMKTLEGKLSDVKTQLQRYSANERACQEVVGELNLNIKMLEIENEMLRRKVDKLKNRRSSLQIECSAKVDPITLKASTQIKALTHQLNRETDAVEDIVKRVHIIQTEHSRINRENEELSSQLAVSVKQLESAQNGLRGSWQHSIQLGLTAETLYSALEK
jgi:chromosome segregation ATPase